MIVRDATAADLPAVAALAGQLVRQHHALDPARFAILADPIEPGYQAFLDGEIRDPEAVVLVAADDTAPLGYAYGRLEPASWVDLAAPCGWLHDVTVHEHARRRGIATALVEEMHRRLTALGAPRVLLETAWLNPAAQELFRRLGFRPTMLEMTRER